MSQGQGVLFIIPKPRGQEKRKGQIKEKKENFQVKDLQARLRKALPELYKCVRIVVSRALSNGYSWMRSFWEKEDLISEFFIFLVGEYIPYRADKSWIWCELVEQRHFRSLQWRMEMAWKNFTQREKDKLCACARTLPDTVYLEDLNLKKRGKGCYFSSF